jgi:hypothetical protein
VHTNIQLKDVDLKESHNKIYNLEKMVKEIEKNKNMEVRILEEKYGKKI